jgi:hypothetical protein
VKKRALLVVLTLLIGGLIAAIGCGLKGKLLPRDKVVPDDEQFPPGWLRPAPSPVVPPYDEGSPLPPGIPGRLRQQDLTPEVPRRAAPRPAPAPAESSPNPEASP